MKSRIFDHVVLTRFNVRVEGGSLPSDSWLKDRLLLMHSTLLPAMRSQSIKPERWFIFCAKESPEWFRCEILQAVLGIGEIVYLEGIFSPETVANVVNRISSADYLITTRIDNDDAVSSDFIERIQNEFNYNDFSFLNFTTGAQYSKGWVYWRSDPSNAFVSLIEKRSGGKFRTVFLDWHTRIGLYGEVRQIKTKPVWLQVIHDNNISNQTNGIRISPNILEKFQIKLPLIYVNTFHLLILSLMDAFRLGIRVISKIHRIIWLWKVVFR